MTVRKNDKIVTAASISADLFDTFREGLLNIDPVWWIEKNLILDGSQFRLTKNGYKPFVDIYRYIGLKALEPDAKPVVLVKGRQVGATTMCGALELYFMTCGMFGNKTRAPMRIMHCFPTLVHSYAYTKTKLNTLISSANPSGDIKNGNIKSIIEAKLDNTTPANNSLQFKQFQGGNHIWIESTGVDGDRLRNRTVDCIMFDECQDTSRLAMGAAVKILTKARYGPIGEGMQVYLGTPKAKGSEYNKIWNDSSQQYFHLGCEKCLKHFPLYTPNSDEWEKIWLYGYIVKCTHCGHEQDKRDAAERGKWVAANKDKAKFVGFHINQLYIPEFTKEKIIDAKPENHPTNTERLYKNEVLGEFWSGDGALLNPEDIRTNCADIKRKFRAQIGLEERKRVYAGFDWGKKGDSEQMSEGEASISHGGQSYSCGIILTLEGPQLFSIDFATRLKRNDLQYKKEVVEQMFRNYSVTVGVGDIGYANDLTEELQRNFGDRFLASQALPKVNGYIKFNSDYFPKTIGFERDYHIAELIDLIKKGNIRFPYGDYEQISWLESHCCSMEIKVTTNRVNEPIRRYVKGPSPNDGFMALLNAYLAYKFDVTQGFKQNGVSNNIWDANKKNKIPCCVGYIPRM